MKRRALLSLFVPLAAHAGWTDWRLHTWAQVHCQNGPTISLMIRGQLAKLTLHERNFLTEVSRRMAELERS